MLPIGEFAVRIVMSAFQLSLNMEFELIVDHHSSANVLGHDP